MLEDTPKEGPAPSPSSTLQLYGFVKPRYVPTTVSSHEQGHTHIGASLDKLTQQPMSWSSCPLLTCREEPPEPEAVLEDFDRR